MAGSYLKKYKADILTVGILLMVCALLFLVRSLRSGSGAYVIVEQAGKVIRVYDIHEDVEETFYFEQESTPSNVLVIKDGEAYVRAASCPDQICVRHKHISGAGETIVCLPHRFVVTVTKEKRDLYEAEEDR